MTRTTLTAGLLATALLASGTAQAFQDPLAASRFDSRAVPSYGQPAAQQSFLGDGQLFGFNIMPQNCAEAESRSRILGGVVGAVAGGLLGSSIGGGSGKTVATIAGTGLGILLGSAAGGYVAQQNPDCNPDLHGPAPTHAQPSGAPRDLFGHQSAYAVQPVRP